MNWGDLHLAQIRNRLEYYLGSDLEFLGNSLPTWVLAIGLTLLVFTALEFFKVFLKRKSRLFVLSRIPKAEELFAGLVGKTKNYFLFFLSVLVGSQLLLLPERIGNLMETATMLVFLLQVLAWGNFLIQFWVIGYADREIETDASRATTVKFAGVMLRIVFWLCLFLVALDNVGINVTTLIAGLGVGGIAIGLALQNVLGDIFSSLSIVLDKPFVLGDFIVIGEDSGTIEKIGIKTTRIRRLTGELLVVPNSQLVESRVRNYKRMDERRIVFSFGVIYQTTAEQLRKIPGIVRSITDQIELVRLDRVHFFKFGDSSLDFEVVYYVLSREYTDYMNAQEEVNLHLFERFGQEGIDFAYPTRTLFIEKDSTKG